MKEEWLCLHWWLGGTESKLEKKENRTVTKWYGSWATAGPSRSNGNHIVFSSRNLYPNPGSKYTSRCGNLKCVERKKKTMSATSAAPCWPITVSSSYLLVPTTRSASTSTCWRLGIGATLGRSPRRTGGQPPGRNEMFKPIQPVMQHSTLFPREKTTKWPMQLLNHGAWQLDTVLESEIPDNRWCIFVFSLFKHSNTRKRLENLLRSETGVFFKSFFKHRACYEY